MSTLPLEILTSIFKHLHCIDLARCQRVCKLWNQASLKLLYYKVNLISEKGCERYARTLKSSPHLGKYLEKITAYNFYDDEDEEYGLYDAYEDDEDDEENDTYDIIDDGKRGEKKDLSNMWDKHDLLDTVIDNCPNLLKIDNTSPSPFFLSKLSEAAFQGRLPCLQYINTPKQEHYHYYASTVLGFKKTINSLELPGTVIPRSIGSPAYFLLRQNLNEFSCLQTLTIWYYSRHQIYYYDALIDDCRYLTSLILVPQDLFSGQVVVTKPIQIIRPHYKIETLKCLWSTINTEDQIAYIPIKFPNLKSLDIGRDVYVDTVCRFSVNALRKFFLFVIGLKKIYISIILHPEDCINSWASIINEKISAIDLKITVFDPEEYQESSTLVKFNGEKMTLSFRLSAQSYHQKLLSEIGKKVRSLIFTKRNCIDLADGIAQLVEIAELCPSLQDLTLNDVEFLFFSGRTDYQNFELKSLSLHRYDNYVGSLEVISFMFPNLKRLHLSIPPQYDGFETTVIDMPNTNFDVLSCNCSQSLFRNSSGKIYIKVKTDAGLQFYSATCVGQLQQINGEEYDLLHFDITCRSLTKLEIDT